MRLVFHPEAEAEFLAAIDYYEGCAEGLGHDFAVEVYAATQRILDYPTAWPTLEGSIRRCLARRYPYGILYAQEADEILILAVMNLHRDPGYWKNRFP